MDKVNRQTKTLSAEAFRDSEGVYRFPFTVLDSTRGDANLGRIEWNLELIGGKNERGEARIEKILVFAQQTRDKRYAGKVFEIPAFAGVLSGHKISRRGAFTDCVWAVIYCLEHNAMVLSAYPDNNHKELVINTGSSISIEARFE